MASKATFGWGRGSAVELGMFFFFLRRCAGAGLGSEVWSLFLFVFMNSEQHGVLFTKE